MHFSINNFRAQLTGQGARPNLFEVTVPFPGGIFSESGSNRFESDSFHTLDFISRLVSKFQSSTRENNG